MSEIVFKHYIQVFRYIYKVAITTQRRRLILAAGMCLQNAKTFLIGRVSAVSQLKTLIHLVPQSRLTDSRSAA